MALGPGAASFDKPYVLLCEGVGDERFYQRLFEKRQIGAEFYVRSSGGITNFGSNLNNFALNESFLSNVKAVLLVADNDSNMQESFIAIQEQLKLAQGFGIPDAEQEVAKSKAPLPSVAVLMLPIGIPGNLESLCVEAAYAKFGLQAHLDTFVLSTPANGWSVGKQAKMRMQTILAATNRKHPDAGFAGHWNCKEEFRVPVEHPCFDDLAKFLTGFSALVPA